MNQLFDLGGDIAVVTGALGRLGAVWVDALLGAGARVLALDLPDSPVSDAFDALRADYGQDRLALAHADVRDRPGLEEACRSCERILGTPTILVNNAGIDCPPGDGGPGWRLEDIPLQFNRDVFDVNTLGLFLTTQVFGAPMLTAGYGSIINIGSLYAGVSPDASFYAHLRTDPPFVKPPAYGASKAAVVNLSRYLATHWAARGVRVNTLSPGGVLGGQDAHFRRKFCARVPMGRMADDNDLHGPLLFLASRASAYVTGTEVIVDGGFSAW